MVKIAWSSYITEDKAKRLRGKKRPRTQEMIYTLLSKQSRIVRKSEYLWKSVAKPFS